MSSDDMESVLDRKKISYLKDVKPILDSRCVVCHSCYDAPCQLKLGSIEGIDRGATKQLVYDFVRFKQAEPTRLFIDATNTAGWRAKDFYPVLNERSDNPSANLDNSLLAQMLQLKRDNPLPSSGRLENNFDFNIDRDLQCPTREEFPKYQHEHPKWGMPYGLPGLSQDQENTLKQWLKEGAKAEPQPAPSPKSVVEINIWETYFNGSTPKQKLVFQYIYEHLFIGHLHFMGHPDDEFFRLVRSLTPPGMPIKEINSIRQYDDPGTKQFYYRLRSVTETIVDKIHFVYELNDRKMKRYDELFFAPDYEVNAPSTYQPGDSANPFRKFAQLPLVSRYKFLLDDAEYFVSGFIKGPVCRGQIATESIRDRFWVVFMQPGKFFPKQFAKMLDENSQLLSLPGEEEDNIGLLDWIKYDDLGKKYLRMRDKFNDSLLPENQGFGLEHIWDGEGENRNAGLTIFRHYNSATVVKGLVGKTPLTAWVVGYPLLERLHYLLVAGFNPYSTASHQLASRTYMDILRQGAQNNFLRFMPAMERQSIYNSWTLDATSFRTADAYFNIHHESQVKFKTTRYKEEFFDQVRARMGKAAGAPDSINDCRQSNCLNADAAIRQLASLKGLDLSVLPELSLLRLETDDPKEDLLYSMVVDRAFSNITWLLNEESRHMPELDELTVMPNIIGSYPNFFFHVRTDQLEDFVQAIKTAKDPSTREQFYAKYGIRRTNPAFWQYFDWFNQKNKKLKGVEGGLLDLSRYENL
jgi:Fatty acid cis/trans isomerase (CTI)